MGLTNTRNGVQSAPMNLRTFLRESKQSTAEFAAALTAAGFPASPGGVRKWVTGERVPRPDAMRAIQRVTHEKVCPPDFINGSSQEAGREAAA